MSYSQLVGVDVLRTLGFASISGTYAALGTAFAQDMRLICLTNNTKGDIFVAVTPGYTPASDGTADNIFIAAGGFKLFDLTSNSVNQPPSVWVFNKGTQFLVRQSSAPVSGSVYLECLYGIGET
jgi:hypothetical protein